MKWTRSDTLALALDSCVRCHGVGLRPGRGGEDSPCNCVLRGIFRNCFNRFRECASKEGFMTRASQESFSANGGRMIWGRKDEEYVADFSLVTRRTLSAEEYRIFKYHFLLGADWNLCCRRLNIERKSFFHIVLPHRATARTRFSRTEAVCTVPGGRVLPKQFRRTHARHVSGTQGSSH